MILFLVAAGALGAGAAWLYNDLVRARNRVDEALAQIDVQLCRRLDLIPALVAAVSGYAAHERGVLERAMRARTRGLGTDVAGRQADDGEASAATRELLAVAEAYPDLKADRHFRMIQEELTSTENRIAFARQFFNDAVRIYNTKIESLPWLVLAGPLGFARRELFESTDTSAPAVRFPGS